MAKVLWYVLGQLCAQTIVFVNVPKIVYNCIKEPPLPKTIPYELMGSDFFSFV
jgi:hypothetical protein